MFQFTTTNVINSNVDSTGKALWTCNKNNVFRVKRVGNFKKENVTAVYKTLGFAGINAKVAINFASCGLATGDQARLFIYLGLTEACQDSRFANDFYRKGKPFNVDFEFLDTADNTVKALVKNINKYQVYVFGEKLLNVSVPASGILLIEATNEFQRFNKVNVEKFIEFGTAEGCTTNPMGEYKVVMSLDKLTKKTDEDTASWTGTTEGFYSGREGFGTYSYILHNLRIPTSMRTRAFGINQEETPIPGALYDEYVIHYSVNRGVLGSNAVGDQVTSNTTHIFYVKHDLPATPAATENGVSIPGETFDTAIAKIGSVKVMDEPKTKTPTENPEELISGTGIKVKGKTISTAE